MLGNWGTATWLAMVAAHLPPPMAPALRIFELRCGVLAAATESRRSQDGSGGQDESTTERGGRLESFTLGVGRPQGAEMWFCGRPRAEISTRKSTQVTLPARFLGPVGVRNLHLGGLGSAQWLGTAFGWRTTRPLFPRPRVPMSIPLLRSSSLQNLPTYLLSSIL